MMLRKRILRKIDTNNVDWPHFQRGLRYLIHLDLNLVGTV